MRTKKGWYVVFRANEGHETGVYESWPEAKAATDGCTGSPQKFKSAEEAHRAFTTGVLVHPSKFYVVEGGDSRVYHVYDRAVDAAEGLGVGRDKVHKFKAIAEAETFARNNYARRRPPVVPDPEVESQRGPEPEPEPAVEDGPPRHLDGEAGNRGGRIIAFDTETTGLDSSRDQIVQFSMCIYDDGSLVRSETFRLRPTVAEMSEGAQALHGISMADLQGERTFADVAQDLYETFGTADGLMGYNVMFDIGMLDSEFNRLHDYESLNWRNYFILDPYTIWTSRERRTLSGAHQRFWDARCKMRTMPERTSMQLFESTMP